MLKNGSIFLFLVLISYPFKNASAQALNTEFLLQSGETLKIDAFERGILRIRLNEPDESLMERYSLLNKDLKRAASTVSQSPDNYTIATEAYTLTILKKTGEITIAEKGGKSRKINFNALNEGLSKKFEDSITEEFKHIQSHDAIIGDTIKVIGEKIEKRAVSDKKRIVSISLEEEERFYGGGASSRKNIQHRGEILRIWATYQKSDIVTPFVMSTGGWGIYNNTTAMNYFDIGRFSEKEFLVYNTDSSADFYLFFGNSLYDIIDRYTQVTGRPYLLPQWAYGLAFGGHTSENMLDIMNDALRFREEKIPCDIYWIEPQWMEERYDYSTNKYWNLEKFPAEPYWQRETVKQKYKHPYLFVNRLNNLGFRLALWLNVEQDFSYEEEDALAQKAGKPLSGKDPWFNHLTKFIDKGVDGFKLGPARTLDEHPTWKYYNGLTDREMHNMNQVLMPKNFYQMFRNHTGRRSFHHYCGGYAGTQRWAASTSGDNGGGKDALYDQLNLGISGFLNSSADVMEVYHSEYQPVVGEKEGLGGIHLGFFLPWVQINSWFALYHPWYQSPVEKEAIRYYSQLRNRLHPYIYSAAIEGSLTGKPIVRAMPLEFPKDKNVENTVYQYMFGENLLVGVFSDSVYLPEGKWINYWSGKKVTGGKTVDAEVQKGKGGPLFIRPGAIIPYKPLTNYITESPIDTLIVKVYPEGESRYTLFKDDGESFEYEAGNIASTLFTCKQTPKSTLFTIHPVNGTYKNMPESMAYNVEIARAAKPLKVTVNGKAFTQWKWSEGFVKVPVNGKNNQETRIEIQ